MLPCSQSTMTQSAPDLARILETLAPGSICQNPMAGRRPSVKTCFSLLDRSIFWPVSMADIARRCWPRFDRGRSIDTRQLKRINRLRGVLITRRAGTRIIIWGIIEGSVR